MTSLNIQFSKFHPFVVKKFKQKLWLWEATVDLWKVRGQKPDKSEISISENKIGKELNW